MPWFWSTTVSWPASGPLESRTVTLVHVDEADPVSLRQSASSTARTVPLTNSTR
jgi:hypothetical protein